MSREFVRVENLKKRFVSRRSEAAVNAVNDVSFTIAEGSTLGLVGESGSGKSTVGRCLLRLTEPTAGNVHVGDTDVISLQRKELRAFRRHVQMVFQDPLGSLTPRMMVGDLIEEPLIVHTTLDRKQRRLRVLELMAQVELGSTLYFRYPRQLSGGQQQRVALARTIATNPRFIVLDEPTSAMDMAVRSEILDLLARLQRERSITYLLISHDLRAVEFHSTQLAVMYLGKIVESGPTQGIFASPTHPYTRALLRSVPTPDPAKRGLIETLEGEIPSPVALPQGCYFSNRCPIAISNCLEAFPPFLEVRPGHLVACYRANEDVDALEKRSNVMRATTATGPLGLDHESTD